MVGALRQPPAWQATHTVATTNTWAMGGPTPADSQTRSQESSSTSTTTSAVLRQDTPMAMSASLPGLLIHSAPHRDLQAAPCWLGDLHRNLAAGGVDQSHALVFLAPVQNGIFPSLTAGWQTFHYLKTFCGLHERNFALRMKML